MNRSPLTALLGVLLTALVVGVTLWIRLALARKRLRERLRALGASFAQGGAGLPVPPSPVLLSAPTSPEWSATFARGALSLGVYPLKNGFPVVTWRSRSPSHLRFVLRGRPNTGNRRHPDLEPVDIDGAFTYGAPPKEVEAFLKGAGATLFQRFVRRTTGTEGWQLLFDAGACYLVRYIVVEELDAMAKFAEELEDGLAQSS